MFTKLWLVKVEKRRAQEKDSILALQTDDLSRGGIFYHPNGDRSLGVI